MCACLEDPKATLDSIQIIKKLGGSMEQSFLDEGFLLDKRPGLNQPRRIENARGKLFVHLNMFY